MDLLGRTAPSPRRDDQPDHLAGRQPRRGRRRGDAGSPSTAPSCSASAATCPAPTGTAYVYDPDGHTNELYYGIEQVGWDGYSKPRAMYDRGFREAPTLPQINEFQEVQDAMAKGIDVHVRLPPRRRAAGDVRRRRRPAAAALQDHEDRPRVSSSSTTWSDASRLLPRRARLQRDGGDHAGRATAASSCAPTRSTTRWRSTRWRCARSSASARTPPACPSACSWPTTASSRTPSTFLRENGVRVETDVPAELHPGIDYAAHAFDPDGHCIQLYYYMEQVGWDGQPRPASMRPHVDTGELARDAGSNVGHLRRRGLPGPLGVGTPCRVTGLAPEATGASI